MVTRSLWVSDKNDHRGQGSLNRLFHCACCTPPRQLYYQARGRLDLARHEADHTPATAPVSLARRRRMLRARS